jgi:hypothetical protein
VQQVLPILTAALLLIGAGIVHGLRSDRWGRSEVVQEAAARLKRIPTEIRDWTSEEVSIDTRQLQIADLVGHLCRRYTHQPTGISYLVLIVSGRPGAIGAHTPDVCYQGAGYRLKAPTLESLKVGATQNTFWQTVAERGEPRLEYLSLWWAWSTDGVRWEASNEPRLAFAKHPSLYKLYVIRSISRPDQASDTEDATRRFLETWCPVLKKALSPA